jgi:hypothetical protein
MSGVIAGRVVVLGMMAASCVCADSNSEKRDKKQRERIEELSAKLSRRLAMAKPSEEHAFLHQRAEALIERLKQSRRDEYVFDRVARAANSVLEASERIFESGEKVQDEDDTKEKAARNLQRYYFRLQQAEYFGNMSGDPDWKTYARDSRMLYQKARSAFDAGNYRKARKLGEASGYLVGALENLAQAAVRIPDPPRLK